MAKAEGKRFKFDSTEKIRTDFLETFPFDSKGQTIQFENDEFSAVCPFSGLPDLGSLMVAYQPQGGVCVELKSFKYYLVSFRNVGLYQEGCTKRIHDDLKKLLGTKKLIVKTVYKPRGGIVTTCIEGQ